MPQLVSFLAMGLCPPFGQVLSKVAVEIGRTGWAWLSLLREGSQGPRISARIQVGGDFGTGLPVRWLDLTTCQWWAGWGSPVDRHPCAGVGLGCEPLQAILS